MLLWPQEHRELQRRGVGFVRGNGRDFDIIVSTVRQLLAEVRRWGRTPLEWHRSLWVPISKPTGEGCDGLRVIN